MKLQGQTALVTGASSGIGLEFARQLAAMGADLVITARRAEQLEKLAKELERDRGVNVSVIPLDLSDPSSPERLWKETEGSGQRIDVLVNNAGFGTLNRFAEIPWEVTRQQMQVNMLSLTHLTYLFLRAMLERRSGYILNVSSIGAYLPVPLFATYASGKAYVRNFTESLARELTGTGVRACCLCPGGTATEFMQVAGQKLDGLTEMSLMSAERCARIGLSALFRGRHNIVSGYLNSLGMWLLRFVPRVLMTWIASSIIRRDEGGGRSA